MKTIQLSYGLGVNVPRIKFSCIPLLFTGVLATLVITPFISLDPINMPKMLVVVSGASLLLPFIAMEFKGWWKNNALTFFLSLTLIFSMTVALFSNSAPRADQFWGTWGRSTGYLTYIAFIVCMLTASILVSKAEAPLIRKTFERVSYFISGYALLQAGDLDPIEWSQKAIVATLGNINFMSSFLGLASISFFSRLLMEKISATAKMHFVLLALLNLYLIWLSGSIQGLGIFASGASMVVAMYIRSRWNAKLTTTWLFLVTPLGMAVFLGTAGFGPFSVLKQETVIFRRDYWLAGLRMTLDNWLNGVGIDSYGDFYQQYRDRDAVVRTGPQRVTNTAHNIFLDVSSGAGVLAGIVFVAIFVATLALIYKMIKTGNFQSTDVAASGIFLGFVVFCLISINQIGVGVWGFIFMGYLQGSAVRQKNEKVSREVGRLGRSATEKFNDPRFNLVTGIVTLLFGIAGFALGLAPVVTDAQMLSAVKGKDFENMKEVASKVTATQAHKERYLGLLLQEGRDAEAFEFAKKTLKLNPRSEISLRIIGSEASAPKSFRIASLQKLIERDPNNAEFTQYIQRLIDALE
jgi:O-antigen ligase